MKRTPLKYGFKAKAKRLAIELREEISLGPFEAFEPWQFCQLYGTPVYHLRDLDCSSGALKQFSDVHPEAFSGALIPVGTGHVVLENENHPETRRRSTLSHEVAHLALEHEFPTTLVNETGCRRADKQKEAEASELSGELLIPFEAAKKLASSNSTDEEVAEQFGVSLLVARWRMNGSGARVINKRRKVAYTRRFNSP